MGTRGIEQEWTFLKSETSSPKFRLAATQVFDLLIRSELPGETIHAESTRKWTLALNPEADEVLQFAAIAHDIERGRENRLRSDQFGSYDEYKQEHARVGAEIACKVATSVGYSDAEVDRIRYLITNHETGGADPGLQTLTNADSLSFFENNLPYYLESHGATNTNKKVKFMYVRMSNKAKQLLKELSKTNELVAEALKAV
jgi:Domain of unknown function (DUF4202)